MTESPFLRNLLRNLRISFFVIVAFIGIVVAVALFMKQPAEWEIIIFVGIGMLLSSVLNALYDGGKEKGKQRQ